LSGFQVIEEFSKPNLSNLHIAFPKQLKSVNLVAKTIDGRYLGEATLSLNLTTSGWTEVILPSKYKNKLKKYKSDEVAILASNVEVIGKKRRIVNVYPTSWGKPSKQHATFYVNAGSEIAVLHYFQHVKHNESEDSEPQREEVEVLCAEKKAKIRAAYNFECQLESTASPINNRVSITSVDPLSDIDEGQNSLTKSFIIWLPK
jgi:hypothetical protein